MIHNATATLREVTISKEDLKPRYVVDQEDGFIDKGSYGHVFKGYDMAHDSRPVALKISHDQNDIQLDKHFRREFDFLSQHPHSNIITVYAHHLAAGRSVLAMEFAESDLATVMGDPDKNFTLDDVIKWLEPVAAAIDHIHSFPDAEGGIVAHRDIKPSNILICSGGAVKLSDFGCAGFSGTASSGKGTMAYRAPEGFDDGGKYYPGTAQFYAESDIYSMVVATCEFFAKSNPFAGISKSSKSLAEKESEDRIARWCKKRGMPNSLIEALVRGMHPDYNQRFHSGAEYIDALRGVKVTIDREAARKAAEEDFGRFYKRFTTVAGNKPSGWYGTTGLDDIDELWTLHDTMENLARDNGFTGDKRYARAIKLFEERMSADFKVLKTELSKAAAESQRFRQQGRFDEGGHPINYVYVDAIKGELNTQGESLRYNLGATLHAWGPPLADERLSKQKIEDGSYSRHCAENFPQGDPNLKK